MTDVKPTAEEAHEWFITTKKAHSWAVFVQRGMFGGAHRVPFEFSDMDVCQQLAHGTFEGEHTYADEVIAAHQWAEWLPYWAAIRLDAVSDEPTPAQAIWFSMDMQSRMDWLTWHDALTHRCGSAPDAMTVELLEQFVRERAVARLTGKKP